MGPIFCHKDSTRVNTYEGNMRRIPDPQKESRFLGWPRFGDNFLLPALVLADQLTDFLPSVDGIRHDDSQKCEKEQYQKKAPKSPKADLVEQVESGSSHRVAS
jgi:hypothetical protein